MTFAINTRSISPTLLLGPLGIAVACGALLLSGCSGTEGSSDADSSNAKQITVRVLIVDDEQLGDTAARLWSAENRGKIEVTHVTLQEFAELDKRPAADVLIYPPQFAGDLLLKNFIDKLPEHVAKDSDFQRGDVFHLERTATASWADEPIGFSLGSPQIVLLYRKDIFELLGITPPTTWEEYNEAVATIRNSSVGEGIDGWLPAAEPMSATWGSRMFLLRGATYVKHRSRFSDLFDLATGRPLVNQPPFVRALTEMNEALADDYKVLSEMGPDDVSDAVFQGNAALGLTVLRPGDASEIKESELSEQVGVLSPPGSREVYSFSRESWETRDDDQAVNVSLLGVDGRVASVVYLSRRSAAAQEFVLWLAGPDASGKILSRSRHSAPFRKSHLEKLSSWADTRLSESATSEYADLMQSNLGQSLWMIEPRIPGCQAYMRALDVAVQSAFDGSQPIDIALVIAATSWREVHEQYGSSEQKAAYEASLQLD